MPAVYTVAIVGSGFSGVMTAAHLLCTRQARPVRVQMLNRSGVMARGVAYGTLPAGVDTATILDRARVGP